MPNVSAVFMSPKRHLMASDIYRITSPFYYLSSLPDWGVAYGFYGEMVSKKDFDWDKWTNDTDIFVFPRLTGGDDITNSGIRYLLKMLKAAGKKLVYELDDDLTNHYRTVHNHNIFELTDLFDAFTVTTNSLKTRLQEFGIEQPIHVVPNMLQPHLWFENPGTRSEDDLLIGLTGSPTHYKDWIVLKDAFTQLAKRTKIPYQILMLGFQPDYMVEIPNLSFVPLVDYENYIRVIKSCDIILASVDPTDKFNDGKSPLKFIEGAGALRPTEHGYDGGAAVIATDSVVYTPYVQEGTGVLVQHDSNEWTNAIVDLLEDNKKRENLQTQGYSYIKKNYNLHGKIGLWVSAYTSVLKGEPHD